VHRKRKFGGYTVAGVERKEETNRGAQILMAFLVGVIFCGPFIARFLGWHTTAGTIGIAVALDVLLLVLVAVWALRRWDY
jgi:hypothetical protein